MYVCHVESCPCFIQTDLTKSCDPRALLLLRFAATSCLAVFLAMLFELDYRTHSESEQEEEIESLIGNLESFT